MPDSFLLLIVVMLLIPHPLVWIVTQIPRFYSKPYHLINLTQILCNVGLKHCTIASCKSCQSHSFDCDSFILPRSLVLIRFSVKQHFWWMNMIKAFVEFIIIFILVIKDWETDMFICCDLVFCIATTTLVNMPTLEMSCSHECNAHPPNKVLFLHK